MPWVCLQCVIVVFPGHTHLLILPSLSWPCVKSVALTAFEMISHGIFSSVTLTSMYILIVIISARGWYSLEAVYVSITDFRTPG